MKPVFVLIAVAICFTAYAATDPRGGAWTAEVDGDNVQMTLFRRDHGGTFGFQVPLAMLSGLARADATGTAANVQFEMRRSAGTIVFDGRFSDSEGAGHYHFTPSDAFVREMDSLGYSGFSDEQLLVFATTDFSPQMIRDLRAMGYQPTQKEVEEIAIFHVTAEVLREYARLGYPNMTLRAAVNLRIGRVDADYINGMKQLGYSGFTAQRTADLAIIGVRPSYVRELQAAGLTNLTARELENLRVGGITAKKIEEYKKLGYTNLTAHELSEMGIMGVTPDYIRRLQAAGYNGVPPDKMIKLRTSGLVK